ncbi:hypothetical protein BDF14DRAFT_1721253 [Spinellus fusiger]|nr:hypothetical protein BDF14DRAFT_1721253 [Spinellus fusiger]
MTHHKRTSLGLHLLSTSKRLELEEMFTSFDKDKDGALSREEMGVMLSASGYNTTEIPVLIDQFPLTNDMLSFEQFAKVMRPTLGTPHSRSKKEDELREAFEAFDLDKDGVINAAELQKMMQKLGDSITEQEAQQMIKEVDEDKDGVVNFAEFLAMMGVKKGPEARHRYSLRQWLGWHK